MTDQLAVQVAVIGALAALLGGLLGAGSQVWVDSRRRQTERQREDERRQDAWRAHKRMVYSGLLTAMNRYRSTYSNARDRGDSGGFPLSYPEVTEALNDLLVSIGAAALVADDPQLRAELVEAGVHPHGMQWSEDFLERIRHDVMLPPQRGTLVDEETPGSRES